MKQTRARDANELVMFVEKVIGVSDDCVYLSEIYALSVGTFCVSEALSKFVELVVDNNLLNFEKVLMPGSCQNFKLTHHNARQRKMTHQFKIE